MERTHAQQWWVGTFTPGFEFRVVHSLDIFRTAVEGLMYLAPACVFWLLIGVGLLEFRTMVAEGAFGCVLFGVCASRRAHLHL